MKNPKKPKNNLTTEQALDIEKQRVWLNNWNKNRVINGRNINNKTDIPFSDDIHTDDLNYGNKRSKTYGEFDSLNNRIVFDKNYTDKPGIPTHELSHRFQKDLKNNNNSNYNNYIKSPIETMIGPSGHLLGPYTSDPEENHAEINRFRYNNGLKPDQVITPEDMKGYNREGYNLDHFDNDSLMNLLNTTADNSNLSNVNYAAYGGNINKQQNNNNMLNEFNEGGTHEQNPLGGIPMGQGQNGQMNTVEEGETMKGDFVYSDRITLSPDVISQFNLPKSLAGKTAANASKIINKQFEDRSNKIDLSTKQNFLDKIGSAQEAIKAQEQAQLAQSMEANSQEVPDMMGGQMPQGMEEFTQPQQQMFNGGELSQGLSMLGASGAMGQHTGINQAATALDLGNTAFGKTGIDTSGATDVDPGSVKPGMMGVTGALKGAQAGAMFGPIGTGVGAAIGLGAGLIGGFKAKKDAALGHQRFQIGQSNGKISSFAKGGNMYVGGGQLDQFGNPVKPWNQPSSGIMDDPSYKARGPEGFFKPTDTVAQVEAPQPQSKARTFGPQSNGHYEGEMYDGSKLGKVASKVGQYAKDNYGNALRYAPVAMNAYQLHQLNKEGYDTVNPILNNTRYNPEYMDEKALTNQINAESNYAGSALANSTNGSLGSLRNNILGSQLNKTKALSDAYSKVADANRGQNAAAQQFNLGVDEANIARRVSAEDKTAMNKGAFKTEQSKLRGQIGNDLGNIGKEQVYKKLAKEAFGYSYDGTYVKNKDGEVVNDPETNKPMTQSRLDELQGKSKSKDYSKIFKSLGSKDFGSIGINNNKK